MTKISSLHPRFTAEEIQHFRQKLETLRRPLAVTEQDLEEEGLRELNPDDTGEISHIQSPANLGSDTYEQELDLSLAEGESNELQEIEDALVRLDQGTFGVCQRCGMEIPIRRLSAIPQTRYCVSCEAELEKRQHGTEQQAPGRDLPKQLN